MCNALTYLEDFHLFTVARLSIAQSCKTHRSCFGTIARKIVSVEKTLHLVCRFVDFDVRLIHLKDRFDNREGGLQITGIRIGEAWLLRISISYFLVNMRYSFYNLFLIYYLIKWCQSQYSQSLFPILIMLFVMSCTLRHDVSSY